MEKWDHVEIGHLREAPPVLVLEHVAYRYALLIQSGIILTLTEHLGIFAFSCVARNLIAIEIVIVQVILQGVRLQNVLALADEWLSDLVKLTLGQAKLAAIMVLVDGDYSLFCVACKFDASRDNRNLVAKEAGQ